MLGVRLREMSVVSPLNVKTLHVITTLNVMPTVNVIKFNAKYNRVVLLNP